MITKERGEGLKMKRETFAKGLSSLNTSIGNPVFSYDYNLDSGLQPAEMTSFSTFAGDPIEKQNFLFQGKNLLPVFWGILIILLTLTDSFAEASNATKLVFLGNKNIAPVVYLDNGIPSGVVVDIVRAIAKHIPQPIEIKIMDWSEAQALVARGEADALIQINQTEERKKQYDFSDTLLESQFSIFTSANRVGISGLSSLGGLRVGVESGGLPQQLLKNYPHVLLTIIPNFIEGFKLLSESTLDAVVVDFRVGSYVLAKNKLRNIKVTDDPIAFSYSSIAVKKGKTKLLNAINNALQIIKADGTYQNIIDKWKPKEVIFQTREQIRQKIYHATIFMLLIVFLIAAIWMVTLKKELTKRKAAEESLREQYSTLHSIINSTNALIFSVDMQYCYTSFNLGHATTMKALYGAEIEQNHSLLEYMTVPEDREIARRNLDRALAGEQLVEEAYSGEELRSRQYFQVSHSPIKTETGEVIGAAVFAHDMTEHKKLEKELGMAKKMEIVGQLAGGVAHEVRNPLNAILSISEALFKEKEIADNQEYQPYIVHIRTQVNRLSKLMTDLLDLGKPIIPAKIKPVSLGRLCADTIGLWNLTAAAKEHPVAFVCDSSDIGGPSVHADEPRLQQAILNLIENAAQASREGGEILLRIMEAEGRTISVQVKDLGKGIAQERIERVFEPFFTLRKGGTGLGLTVVKHFIEHMGGEIRIRNNVPPPGCTAELILNATRKTSI